jgi:hypothetical protein
MPIYHKSVRLLMKDEMVPAFGLQPGQSFTRQQAIDWFSAHYPKISKGTITAHLCRLSTNAKSRIQYYPTPGEDDLFVQIDSNHFRLYNPNQDVAPIYRVGETGAAEVSPDEEEEPEASAEFAYESDLRNYLAKNLSVIEPGLKLYTDQDEGTPGVEFPVGGRFIDILAVSSEGDFVVIELKVSRGYDRVVGQLLRYMAWIGKYQAKPGQKVRGVIVAREISEDLLLACSMLQNVRLFEYQMSLALKSVAMESDK